MDEVEKAFSLVDRANFVPDDLRAQSDIDSPLPIGFGQTNSQPTTVKMMLRWLELEPGDKVLDVGSGSGWTSALLSHLVGPEGVVYAVELIPELVEFGRQNTKRLGLKNINFFQAGKRVGLAKFAPYDRILVSASAQELPLELIEQLKVGGKMVVPVQNDVLEILKHARNHYSEQVHRGFVFVPLL